MDNQPWDKAKLEEWRKFWESEMGQTALGKMKAIKEQMIAESMGQGDTSAVMAYIGRAAGVELVLQDIKAGFDALDKLKDSEKEAKAKGK